MNPGLSDTAYGLVVVPPSQLILKKTHILIEMHLIYICFKIYAKFKVNIQLRLLFTKINAYRIRAIPEGIVFG